MAERSTDSALFFSEENCPRRRVEEVDFFSKSRTVDDDGVEDNSGKDLHPEDDDHARIGSQVEVRLIY